MKPEIEEVLNSIGYQHALTVNPSIFFWAWEPTPKGGYYFADKKEAAREIKSLMDLIGAVLALSPVASELLDNSLKTPHDWDADRSPMWFFQHGLADAAEKAIHELENVHGSGRGRSPNVAANAIAEKMAEIYVLGLGEMPTYGLNPVDQEPSTRFCSAVRDVFSLVGVNSDWRTPCANAVRALRAVDSKRFKALLEIRTYPIGVS